MTDAPDQESVAEFPDVLALVDAQPHGVRYFVIGRLLVDDGWELPPAAHAVQR